MQVDQDDKALSKLYQQRKNSLSPPEIHFSQIENKGVSYYSWGKLLAALLGGCFASFGILAVISHLSRSNMPPPINIVDVKQQTEVEFQQDDLSKLTAQAVQKALDKINKPTPPITSNRPALKTSNLKAIKVQAPVISESFLPNNTLLQIKQSEITLQATHMVLPTLKPSSKHYQTMGTVRLAYHITDKGLVSNIRVINSTVAKAVEKSAISALAQWRYMGNKTPKQSMEVIFDFKKAK